MLEKTRRARAELLEHAADDPSAGAAARRRFAARGAKLQRLAANELLQLRLACIHPQLTAYWRELSAELQLEGGGGALSMEEILKRMRDGAQLELQARHR